MSGFESLSYEVPDHWLTEEKIEEAIPGYRKHLRDPRTRERTIEQIIDLYPAKNFGDFLSLLARTWPDRIALREGRYRRGPDGTMVPFPPRALSFRDLDACVTALARELLAKGLRKGDRVGIVAENSIDADLFEYACLKIGAVTVSWTEKNEDWGLNIVGALKGVGVSAVALQGAATVSHVLKERGEKSCLDTALHHRRLFPIDGEAQSVIERQVGLPVPSSDVPPLEDIAASVSPNDPAMILYSSGTGSLTAKPISLSHANILHHAFTAPALLMQPVGGEVFDPIPHYHVFGKVSQIAQLSGGAAVTNTTVWNMKQTQGALLKKGNLQFGVGVPEFWVEVRRKIEKGLADTAEGRGEPLDLGTLAPTLKRFPKLLEIVEWCRREIARCAQEMLPEDMHAAAREDLASLFDLGLEEELMADSTAYWGPVLEGRAKPATGWRRFLPRKVLARIGYAVMRLKAGLSQFELAINGGGALPAYDAAFFRAIGQPLFAWMGPRFCRLFSGYGATEAPFISIPPALQCKPPTESSLFGRLLSRFFPRRNFSGLESPAASVGKCPAGTEAWTEKSKEGNPEVLVAGPGVACYLDPDLNRERMCDGALRMGDIGKVTRGRFIVLMGREKRLVKPASGISVNPEQYELALCSSPLITGAYVVGEGRPHLGALIVCSPEARQRHDGQPLTDAKQLRDAVDAEIKRLTGRGQMGHRTFIGAFQILPGDFPDSLRSQVSKKLRPHRVEEYYRKEIEGMYPEKPTATVS